MKLMKNYQLKNLKISLIVLVLAISTIGILVVGSAKPSYQGKQIMGVILGVIAMLIVSMIDYNWLLNFSWIMYAINVGLLVLVKLIGKEVNGAQRWIDLKVISVQPSDLTKIFMIIFFAKFLMDHEEDLNEPKNIIKAVILILPSLVLIVAQPNLSNTICVATLFCVLMFIGGLSYKFIRNVLLIAVPLVVIFLVIAVQPNQKLLKDYQQKRILSWLEPDKYADQEAYQQINSLMAIGSGQATGKGLNNKGTTSVKNGNFISEPQTDFIFAIIGEELGFVGCCITIILLLLIVIQCIIIGTKAQNLAGQIICGGVAALIGIQSFINISVATRIFPNTGIPLPFVSYGLTSLVTFFIGIGLVLNVGLQPKKY